MSRLPPARLLGTLAIAWASLAGAACAASATYAGRPEVADFVAAVAARHGLDPEALLDQFRHASVQAKVLRAIMPPRDPKIRSWRVYRSRYLDALRIDGGLAFWARHAAALREAQARFGVPQEIIVAIIGVETIYGRMTGEFQTLSALATLAFDYPPRAELFRAELEELLLLARDTDQPAHAFRGSYAGALGLPQFLPSSYRRYALDFDGDGRTDLAASPEDAIGSVANFLRVHGWIEDGPIALRASVPPQAAGQLADGSVLPRHLAEDLARHGVAAAGPLDPAEPSAVIDLVSPDAPTEFWLGFRNFYVITRYNRSSFYAMAVFQLAEALRTARRARTEQD
jgi:membrane-bound lytic murein transglycosylase B